ncbi:MAG: lytic transglycosylase F [gamma proteobacterium symbiont of Ctena orbiculata]|nr:membrane-bound lytic murein transglycosylase MltF [Candidatus Thiodiazotropha taylori]PUB82196.1 MAG: membrane-bound lytic murein transglycosylase MltF [gamma proteobacterium symbiont of Ctena orbiculata]MBT2995045.1 membrane-bound lytic murein transglycosylase MltF [Candidatus Thiodiazotropha taylori]MBT3000036.1 membrane-bound lytic murein transglycosylase MltF [Candidatus Thiodiazotropha taylori]MBT3028058.1 membrane-bound lytic murein transglycosylase MltF [Candidatus Thiodiazotropha tay
MQPKHRTLLVTNCLLAIASLLGSCSIPPPLVERIKAAGELVVATRNSGTTLYEGSEGLTGFEYELVQLFSEELGVKAHFIIPKSFEGLLPTVVNGDAHLAAAGLTVTPEREAEIRFGPSYQEITQQVVYRSGERRPRKVKDLIGKDLHVLAGSSHEEELVRLKDEYPDLTWISHTDLESAELMQMVQDNKIDFTIADSNEFAVTRRFMPYLKVGFDLTQPQPLAWAMAHAEDASLYNAMEAFFTRIREDGTLAQLIERHYGHIGRLNFVELRTFIKHIKNRLPDYQTFFEDAAKITDIDWRMLAAIGYQESHWDPKAKSPTGVRGIMMLTLTTAKQMKIESRLDPEQSIIGGAKYLRFIEKLLPERIKEPDRLWLTLAGYNVGFGHLEDARILTEHLGDDPDKWADVKKHLPKLSLKKWYTSLKRGYARGNEPVNYVDNIRAYYELLKWQLRQLELAERGKEMLSPALKITPEAL